MQRAEPRDTVSRKTVVRGVANPELTTGLIKLRANKEKREGRGEREMEPEKELVL